MASKTKINTDSSTEERIKEAARKLFTLQGFEATRTRDIANEAGINLALLNYYFRSKEKLFEIVMLENIGHFFQGVIQIVNDEKTDFYEKIELLVDFYVTKLIANPDVPLFVLNEARKNPEKLPMQQNLMDTCFMKQFNSKVKAGKIKKMHPGHLMMNIMGLTVFPFAAKPMVQRVRDISNKEFEALMWERKKLVPEWIKLILEKE